MPQLREASLRLASPKLELSAIDGARGGSSREPFVAAPGFNIKVVNRPAPDLFPAMYLVKIQCTRNETKGRGALGRRREHGRKPLKKNEIISLTISH
jgi:hypothetical protein